MKMVDKKIKTIQILAAGGAFTIQNPLSSENLDEVLSKVTQAILKLAIPIAVVMILWAGFNFLTAAGNSAKITRGKDILKWTVVGLAIIFIGGGFIDLLKNILGTS